MNILLLGYGKMGQLIGRLAEERGHTIAAKINIENKEELGSINADKVDVAIEFSQPEAAVENIKWCIDNNIPIVSGTTGWMDQKPEIERLTSEKNGAFFYASNYSIGVNLFFKVNEFLAKLMNENSGYRASVEEIHHTAKKDAPSGTAITLAEGILKNIDTLTTWKMADSLAETEHTLPITSKRIDPAPGTHIIRYQSAIDDIEITHTAHSRQGFALGAILVAEWIQGRKGVLSMDDFLSF
jgi:4-hydroxy-tetrahydrodipicolinate reductase